MITHYSNKNQLTKVLRIIFEKWSGKFHKISKIHTLDLKFRSFSHQKNVCFDFRWTIEFLLIFTAILEARYWFIRLVSNQTNKKALVLKGGESRTNHPVFYSNTHKFVSKYRTVSMEYEFHTRYKQQQKWKFQYPPKKQKSRSMWKHFQILCSPRILNSF